LPRTKKDKLDKFYTAPEVAKRCGEKFAEFVEGFVVEPSAGSGSFGPFVDLMLDIAPEGEEIEKQDFFEFDSSSYKNYLGNPPFGVNASLAKKFFNHAAKGKGFIGFILPRTFRKVSVQNSLDLNFHLVYDELLKANSFILHGESYSVPCVFQIWEWREEPRKKVVLPTEHEDFHFVDPLKYDYDFAVRRVGGLAGKVMDVGGAIPSHYFLQMDSHEVRLRFESLYEQFQEVASNTAGNPSLGKGELISIYQKSLDIL
jgi:hypothetical protein